MSTQSPNVAPNPGERLAGAPAVLLVNTRSRSGRHSYARAHRALLRRGIRLLDVQPILRPGRLVEAVRAAARARVPRIIVGGGDGTLSAAADVLAGTDCALGVLPLGTGNDFARSLGLPVGDVEAACEVIARGHTARVDLGLCGERHFLNAASVGLTTEIARSLSGAAKRRLGPLAYPIAAARAAWVQAPFQLTLREDEDGEPLRLSAVQLVVGNGRFQGGGQLIAPEATLQDRALDVYAVISGPIAGPGAFGRARTMLGLAAVGTRLLRGTHVDDPRVLHLRTQRLEVHAEPAQQLDLDGELMGATPALFRIAPGALRVLVPALPAAD